MVDTYNIHLVNTSASSQTFWCFLARPQELVDDPGVYANSSANLEVDPNSPADNYFGIPVQYVVGAGASNQAVGLNIQVVSSVINDADVLDTWDANYADWPPNKGPTMSLRGTKAPPNSIAIVANPFNQITNENNHWFSNQSFGIETASGFIGMSWSPKPNQKRTLIPKLKFYVSTGDFDSNSLADWNDVSNTSIEIDVPSSFLYGDCTVTYDQSGNWSQTPGKLSTHSLVQNLGWFQSDAHTELVALAYLSQGKVQTDELKSVHWDKQTVLVDVNQTHLSGTVTVAAALTAAFTIFVLGGVTFILSGSTAGATTVHFSYNGTQSVQALQALFTAGAQLAFGGAS